MYMYMLLWVWSLSEFSELSLSLSLLILFIAFSFLFIPVHEVCIVLHQLNAVSYEKELSIHSDHQFVFGLAYDV